MKKKNVVVLVIILIAILGIGIYYYNLKITGGSIYANSQKAAGGVQQVLLTKDNFNLFLEQQQVVRDLPSNAKISLRLYNFNSGSREWEKSYIITKGKAIEGLSSDVDLEIILSSRYIFEVAKDLCSGVKKAKENNDMGFNLKISTASFLWKYKGMLKYRSCFGF